MAAAPQCFDASPFVQRVGWDNIPSQLWRLGKNRQQGRIPQAADERRRNTETEYGRTVHGKQEVLDATRGGLWPGWGKGQDRVLPASDLGLGTSDFPLRLLDETNPEIILDLNIL